ncbi:MAG: hypothetical protein J5542_10705 [Bacteroidales bacterium]|nr:hypothetical protein [Bacteroidales bacterium]
MSRIVFALKVVIALWLLVVVPIRGIARGHVDVDSVGDIWVFAIDASGSMKQKTASSYRTRENISDIIVKNLDKLAIFDMPNYKQDHFFIYNTGIYDGKLVPNFLVKTLDSKISFVDLFVHPIVVDSMFIDKKVFKEYLKKHLIKSKYPYKYSFVSQIRTSVLVKTILTMSDNGKSQDYRNIYIVTITDDGDLNDQWRSDFKEMQRSSPEKLIEVNGMNSKYIFNPLTGDGGGELKELFTDYDYQKKYYENIPHIWLHKYVSKEYVTDTLNMYSDNGLWDITARNGKCLCVEKIGTCYNGDTVCFVHVDSIRINGTNFHVNRSIVEKDSLQMVYDNKFKMNDVVLYGEMQVKYNDSIYGPHYKKYPIVFSQTVLSDKMFKLIWIVASIVLFVIIMLILYFFVIKPRMVLFSIYLSNGEKCTVRRGTKQKWHQGVIPLLAADVCSDRILGMIFNCHKCIDYSRFEYDDKDDNNRGMVVVSPTELTIAANKGRIVRHFCTNSDIKRNFSTHTGDCPELLMLLYRQTMQYRLFEMSKKCNSDFFRKIQRAIASHISPMHYYFINYDNKVNGNDKISIGSRRRGGCIFLIEFDMIARKRLEDHDYINDMIYDYYKSHVKKHSDALLRWERSGKHINWYLVQLEYDSINLHSLRSVRLYLFYQMPIIGDNEINKCAALMVKIAKKELGVKTIDVGRYVHGECSTIYFDTSKSVCTNYITFVEDDEAKKSQLLYSPIIDGMLTKEKEVYVKKMGNGHLYSSILPFEMCNADYMYTQMSTDKTDIPQNNLERLLVSDNEIRFKTITINLKKDE